jgi:hypothetical protein
MYGWAQNTNLQCIKLPRDIYQTSLSGTINYESCSLMTKRSDVVSCLTASKEISEIVEIISAHPAIQSCPEPWNHRQVVQNLGITDNYVLWVI